LITLIICGASVFSAWLIIKIPVEKNSPVKSGAPIETYRKITANNNEDWKKTLQSFNDTSQNFNQLVEAAVLDETTLTSQMSKDIFAQYLLLKSGGREVSEEEIGAIVNNVASSPDYSQISGPKYGKSNIHITAKTDIETTRKYKEEMERSIARIAVMQTNPFIDFLGAIQKNQSGLIAELDLPISIGRAIIEDFLTMTVPADAVEIHLNLLNTGSDVLADAEGLRELFTDPVKGLLALKFKERAEKMASAMTDLNNYFVKKLGE